MRVDALQMRMRSRSPWEAMDLGIRFAQAQWRALFACHAAVTVPMVAICIATYEIATWLPLVLLFFSKPWIDRTSLFVLSRAAFGQPTRLGDLWREQGAVLWRQFLLTWTWRRLSPGRSFTQPIYQLEGSKVGLRRRQLSPGHRGAAVIMTGVFSLVETLFVLAVFSALVWLAPTQRDTQELWQLVQDTPQLAGIWAPLVYGAVMLLLEPFYVASGFAMYLNRRTELEAWDVEQELRRAFAA